MTRPLKGRFAPSPSGRMHLGNIFSAVLSWASVKSRGGQWVLRIEDLDPQRSKLHFSQMIEDDLAWLGLDWDEGGLDNRGPNGPYSQSQRSESYESALAQLWATGNVFPCTCTRAELMATQAPHQSDGRIIYGGRCRPDSPLFSPPEQAHSARLRVADEDIFFTDSVFGEQCVNLARHCGDFILRRADGAWAYQLAVVVDDAAMGVTEVMRGSDLLLSSAQQIYLYKLLGCEPPQFAHVPLLCNAEGRRLSKRDQSLGMDQLRKRYTPRELLGLIAHTAGLTPDTSPLTPQELLAIFKTESILREENVNLGL